MSTWLIFIIGLVTIIFIYLVKYLCLLPRISYQGYRRILKSWYKIPEDSVIFDYPTREKILYLTFDDGPTIETESLLDTLLKYNAKATFFVVGAQAEKYPNIIRRIIREEHEIGNHDWIDQPTFKGSPE